MDDNYFFQNTLVASAVVWSACGAQVILRANTSVIAFSNSIGEDTMTTVDSADVDAALIYRLSWRRCY